MIPPHEKAQGGNPVSERREGYVTLEDARALVALVGTTPQPSLPLVRELRDRGLLSAEDFKLLEGEIQRAQGQIDALIEHADSGGRLEPAEAAVLFAAALGSGPRSEASFSASINRLSQSFAESLDAILRGVEQATDPDRLAVAAERLLQRGAKHTESSVRAQIAIAALRKLSTLAGELSERKRRSLGVLASATDLEEQHFESALDEALKHGPLRSYDTATHSSLGKFVGGRASLHQISVKRASSEADLHAVAELLGRATISEAHAEIVHQILKRYGEATSPTLNAAQAVAGALAPLVARHCSSPTTGAASHDAAALARWAKLFPQLPELAASAQQIEEARSEHKPAMQAEAKERARMDNAIRFIRNVVIPTGCVIVAVGGMRTPAAHDAFDEFGKSPPNWGEWLTKERSQALNNYKIAELIESPRCIGVLVITKPASHSLTNQAKDAADRAGRPIVWIEEATKKKIREGVKTLVENIQKAMESNSVRESV
jgi:hypothetical protein